MQKMMQTNQIDMGLHKNEWACEMEGVLRPPAQLLCALSHTQNVLKNLMLVRNAL
jgi:hypothetical protein